MRRIKTPYEFKDSQVFTPLSVVSFLWKLVNECRKDAGSVVDLGAGDGRFALAGKYGSYFGLEIDDTTPKKALPPNAQIEFGCAFEKAQGKWDTAIGNPPYLRHHYIEMPWMLTIHRRFKDSFGIDFNRQANLFVYFLLLGLDITKEDGVVAMLTPYEWISRPSSAGLRNLIQNRGWDTSIYRFKHDIFDKVMTTAAISIIDKRAKSGRWDFFEVDQHFRVEKRRMASGTKYSVLGYEKRGSSWALRGLSPGSQKLFTLTEGERIHHRLSKSDVNPCVTSLRNLHPKTTVLDEEAFNREFRDAGEKCWLIRSDREILSPELRLYLKSIPDSEYQTATCRDRETWYKFCPFPISAILVASGFTIFGPKIVSNRFKVHHVGSVYGVFAPLKHIATLTRKLRAFDFESRIIAHSGKLKKIEVGQLNGVLRRLSHE